MIRHDWARQKRQERQELGCVIGAFALWFIWFLLCAALLVGAVVVVWKYALG